MNLAFSVRLDADVLADLLSWQKDHVAAEFKLYLYAFPARLRQINEQLLLMCKVNNLLLELIASLSVIPVIHLLLTQGRFFLLAALILFL